MHGWRQPHLVIHILTSSTIHILMQDFPYYAQRRDKHIMILVVIKE